MIYTHVSTRLIGGTVSPLDQLHPPAPEGTEQTSTDQTDPEQTATEQTATEQDDAGSDAPGQDGASS